MANGWQMIKEARSAMGFSRKRVGKNGKIRYNACYRDLRGTVLSARTFATEKASDRAWQKAEVELRQGRVGDPKSTYYLGAFIYPVLGKMPMAEIFPEHIREWITQLQGEGRSAWTIQYCKTSILSSIFTTALNDQITYIHPCRGVRIPTLPATVRTIVTPEQFDVIYEALPDADTQLLVETAIESGLRWGELAELRVNDLDLVSRMLTVSRKVIEVNREFRPEGKRFLVKHYPKDKEYRRLKLSPQIVAKLKAHAQAHNLGPGGLLFARRPSLPAPLHAIIQPEALGFTTANEAGRQYRHGTLSAYNAANAAASTADARSPTTGPSAGQPPRPRAGLPG